MQKLHGQGVYVYFLLFENVPRNKIGTFLNVLSEQNSTEHFFGVERSVLTEHLELMFPRTLGVGDPRGVGIFAPLLNRCDGKIQEIIREISPLLSFLFYPFDSFR